MMFHSTIDSPIGELLLTGDGRSLCGLWMQDAGRRRTPQADWERSDSAFAAARAQLGQYFAGERTGPFVSDGRPGTK